MNLAICIPAQETVHTEFAWCLANLTSELATQQIEHHIFMKQGSMLPEQRHKLAVQAKGYSHMLWLDSDMTFPRTIFHDLVKHEVGIVACNYLTRDGKNLPTAFINKNNTFHRLPMDGTGLIQVDACGMGVMLVESKVFDYLAKPWFNFGWNKETETYFGEDVAFCDRAKWVGYKTWIDQDTSKKIGHIGTNVYRND